MKSRNCIRWMAAWALAGLAVSALAADTLVPDSAPNWKAKTDGSNQGTAWKATTFDDSTWTLGTASFGYGDAATTAVPASKITYYFRKSFSVANPAAYTSLTLRLDYDDGVAVYINGTEVKRLGIAAGATSTTTATSHEGSTGSPAGAWETFSIPTGTLVAGNNVIAVEVHNQATTSSDLHFDLGLIGETGTPSSTLTRGPYLQMAGPSRMTVRWRTSAAVIGRVRYGTVQGSLGSTVSEAAATTEHEVTLTGLTAQTDYFYAVGDASGDLAGNTANHHFETSPAIGADVPTRVWVIGDAGTNNASQTAVFNAYKTRSAGSYTDLMLMLGDNAYTNGTDALAQNAVFNMYADILRQTPMWSCIGNHENDYDAGGVGYYGYMSLPKQAKTDGLSSGVNSGTEAYYSFDHGQIHFICLDSASSQDYTSAGAMYKWTELDLQQNTGKFVVAFWHHPPYSKGSHDSDTDSRMTAMRSNFLPLFELYGVDLVLNGHSHAYERSKFIDSHYGASSTFNNSLTSAGGNVVQSGSGAPGTPYTKGIGHLAHKGAVYNVAGSSGQTSGGTLNHAAMQLSLNVLGSVILTVSGDTLQADFLDSTNTIRDTYQIKKTSSANSAPIALAQSISTPANTAKAVTLSASDVDGNPLTYSVVSAPTQGTLSGTAPNLTYTPNAGATADSFTFKANDGLLDSNVATVGITIGGSTSQSLSLIAAGSAAWRYIDDGLDQGTAWKAPAFNDAAWKTGTASFGYGDPSTTVVMASKITYYFRKSFSVTDASANTAMTLKLNYDDGVAVYLNGTEIKRLGIAAGATYTTTATSHEYGTWETFAIPAGTLVTGNNVIAVEVHNQATSSSDLHLNLELLGQFNVPAAMKAQSLAKTASKPAKAQLSSSRPVYLIGETLSLNYSKMPGAVSDWIAIYPLGAKDLNFLAHAKLGKSSGSVDFARLNLAEGDYEARAFGRGPFTLLGRTTFRVQAEFRITSLVSDSKSQAHGPGLQLGDFWQVQAGQEGMVSSILAEGLRAGDYLASVELKHKALPGTLLGTLQLVQDGRVLASVEVLAEGKSQLASLPFSLEPSGDVELLFLSSGKAALATGAMSLLPVESKQP